MVKYLRTLIEFKDLTWKHWLFIFAIYFTLHLPAIKNDTGVTNLSVHQAKAFLDGRLDIEHYYWDASYFEGKYFVCFPPFPSILVLPVVAIFGEVVKTVLISVLLTFLSMYLFSQILTKLIDDVTIRKWLFLGFFFGTGYWYTVITSHHVNGFAHVVSIAALMLFLFELLNSRRPVLLGIYLAAAFLSRQMTLFYGVLLIYYLFFEDEDKLRGFKRLLLAGLSFSILAFIYLIFNYLRFHDFFETGYKYFVFEGVENWPEFLLTRIENYGLFNIKYLPYNLYNLLIKGHQIVFTGKDHLLLGGIDLFGTSLFVASPFLLAAFKASSKKRHIIAVWIVIALTAVGGLLYHNHGWQQVNTQRFTLDFMPAMMILVALGYKSIPLWLFRGFVIYAIALNLFSFIIHAITSM